MLEDKNFETIANLYWPTRAIRVCVGDTQTYIGRNCAGICHMKPEQIEWLNNHKFYWWSISYDTVELRYRKNKQYERIVWG